MFTKSTMGILIKIFALYIFIKYIVPIPFSLLDITDEDKMLFFSIYILFVGGLIYILWWLANKIMKDIQNTPEEQAYNVLESSNSLLVMFAIYLVVDVVIYIPDIFVEMFNVSNVKDNRDTYIWFISNAIELGIAFSILFQRERWLKLFKL